MRTSIVIEQEDGTEKHIVVATSQMNTGEYLHIYYFYLQYFL